MALRPRSGLLVVALVLSVACASPTPPTPTCGAGDGTEACACRSGEACDDGLLCDDGVCRLLGEIAVDVTDPAARSCEVLVEERAGEVFDARFPSGLIAFVHEAPHVSLAFSRTDDAPFAPDSVRMRHSDGADLVVAHAQCFDRDGRPLAGNPVSLR